MPSTLGTSIIDSLVPAIDSIRGAIHPIAGDRQWNVTLVRRRWSGTRVGEGTASFISQTTISPTPRVEQYVHDELRPAGLEEEGAVIVTEISLTYSEADLTQQPVAANEEVYVRVTDAQGQAIAPRFYTLSRPPEPDRTKRMGWRLHLKRIQVSGSG